jgi:hypothetical protein
MTIPADTATAPTILFPVSLRFLFLTREQKTPIKITTKILQDLNMMTMGKLTRMIAVLLVMEEMKTIAAHMMLLVLGMGVIMLGWRKILL